MANAPAPDTTTVAPVDVCARLPGGTVAAMIGDASAAAFDAGPPYVGGCRWSARSGQRSAGVFVATAASLRLHGQPAVADYVAGPGRQSMAQGAPLAGFGDAAFIDDFGATQVILIADGDRVLQVTATEVGRDVAERLARAALALHR